MTIKNIERAEIQARTQGVCAELGLRIREVRKTQGMTQEKLAEAADVSAKYLSAIENGKEANISVGYLVSIAMALDLDLQVGLMKAE